jgi:hypothetical protein
MVIAGSEKSKRLAYERAPFVILALVGLLAGMWAGLLRIGFAFPTPRADFALLHGGLMVGGFLGTVIGLERAVALKGWWCYLSPAATALAVAALLLGAPEPVAPILILFGGIVLLAMFGVFIQRQPSLSTYVMAAAALIWCVGNLSWLAGRPLYLVVYWWMGFLVLTIVGERLLLSRIAVRSRTSTLTFYLGILLVVTSLAVLRWWPAAAARVTGAGFIVLAWWILRHDIARKTVGQPGLSRFIALSLLTGAGWLGVGGALYLYAGHQLVGPLHDAVLHAVLVGFVFSMIFGHAPLVFPAILNVKMVYHPVLYSHLLLLDASLLLRIVGDLAGWFQGRRVGALLNAVAITLFLVNTVSSVIAARGTKR